ncbi:hypothetical protein U9M48_012113 [Paspalum notatum var. saurae]|uniref:Uncharacterized protein n=1 Tax=Paspalum notatum var. saurae TaxID=547442 RepID=A0AAQ3SWW4_PASNO
MEATGLSVGKSVLNGALSYAKSAIAEEVALQLGVQRDHAFITDELEMMLSFLMAAHEEQDDHKVVKTWVKQVRDVAYDVEDCLQDHAVRLGKSSWWRFLRVLVDRHRVATRMKELRAKVEDVSQRNVRYHLIKGTTPGPKPATSVGPLTIAGSATMFGIDKATRHKGKPKEDLSLLIIEGAEDLRVISVWGTCGALGQSVVIKRAYDDLKKSKKFDLYAWVRIFRPFNPLEFLQSIMMQFYRSTSEEPGKTQETTNIGVQVLENMVMLMKQDGLFGAFGKHVSEKSYLIVLNDLATIEEWDDIKEYFPNCKKGSRIVVSTEHSEVATICAGQESVVSELEQSSVDQSIFASYDEVSQNQTRLLKPGSSSSEDTLDTNNPVMLEDEIHENQFLGDNENVVSKSLTCIRTITSALEESPLVGREKAKSDLINLISKQDDQDPMVISVWGMGGLGKTTLVKEVYQSQELSRLFEKRACITIMRPFVIEDVLQRLAMQLVAESSKRKEEIGFRQQTRKLTKIEALTEELGMLLERKRYLIILDDLSSILEWDMIIQSLPKMENESRIVVTTREENIAKYCSRNQQNVYKLDVLGYMAALYLFSKKVFKEDINLDKYPTLIEEANIILKKCNGLPLAIVTIGGFLAKQPKTPMEWRKLNGHISAELEMNPELERIKTILMKSYDGLPYHLKSCFLYLSIFPEDYNINRRRLVHRWNAEGYLREVRGKSMGEIAHRYFMELIERSMVLPSRESIGSRKGISSCKLHDLMREISISNAMEENLVFRMEEGCSLNTEGAIRHLAISNSWEGDQSDFESIVDLSRIRSLTVFGKWKSFYISDNMRLLRVLDLEGTSGLVDHHLEPIWKLIHLKFLSLRDCQGISHLPESLGKLKQLQTLDVTNTRIIKLPQAITKLRKVQYICAGRVDNEIFGASTYDELVGRMGTKPNKLCMWTSILMIFCRSSCSHKFRTEVLDEDDNTNRRDMCTLFCCIMFPLVARRLADLGGVAVPRGLRKLKALHTLGVVNIAQGKAAILHDIRRLTWLHKLSVTGINKQNCQEFCSTLAHLSSLESLSVHSWEGLRDCLDGLPSAPKNLQSLKLLGNLGKLPDWVAGLQNLVKLKLQDTKLTDMDGTIQVLGKLPNLAILRLLWFCFFLRVEDHLRFSCRQGAFPSLTVLELDYSNGIASVEFEEGTMPKLEVLLSRSSCSYTGLSSLPCLKEVLFRGWIHRAAVKDTRTQLARHHNKPVLKFI